VNISANSTPVSSGPGLLSLIFLYVVDHFLTVTHFGTPVFTLPVFILPVFILPVFILIVTTRFLQGLLRITLLLCQVYMKSL
jgi:hypothetical protein